jgi:hypothetical protein
VAFWPNTVRDRPVLSLLAFATASIAAWFVITLWGPVALIPIALLALTCLALYPWYLRRQDARIRATTGTFSFGDMVVRMQAREQAEELITAKRRERILAARPSTS